MPHTLQSPTTLQEATTSETFTQMLHSLLSHMTSPVDTENNTFPHIIQTHASAVIVTADTVYKVKKPRNFGFFDYSTAELRRHFCQLEVQLNAPLAPGIYLGVTPILRDPQTHFTFGHLYASEDTPVPGTHEAGGVVVDYAVVMRRLPEHATLAARLAAGEVNAELMAEVAHVVARIHTSMPSNAFIAQAGSIAVIRRNWHENFTQTSRYVGLTIPRKDYATLQSYVSQFLSQHRTLLHQRFTHKHIRDCHGDLRLQHVYVLPEANAPEHHHIVLLDRIEFNERFRYGDVASEIAFLCMELDAAQRPDLSQAFVNSYVAETGDTTLTALLPFYCSYRAYVRGKVVSFQLDDPDISPAQQKQAKQEAITLFQLASRYTQISHHPCLLLVGGVMGTGKSTIAQALQHKYRYPLLSTDVIRKELAHLEPTQPQTASFGTGIYNPLWTNKTYAALHDRALAYLQQGYSVILDGTFASRAHRQHIIQRALAQSAMILFIECVSSREVALQRLAQRWQKRIDNMPARQQEVSRASDGRPELYDAQAAQWEAFDARYEPQVRHIILPTTPALEETTANVYRILDPFLATPTLKKQISHHRSGL